MKYMSPRKFISTDVGFEKGNSSSPTNAPLGDILIILPPSHLAFHINPSLSRQEPSGTPGVSSPSKKTESMLFALSILRKSPTNII